MRAALTQECALTLKDAGAQGGAVRKGAFEAGAVELFPIHAPGNAAGLRPGAVAARAEE
jgi:hypothetical protein